MVNVVRTIAGNQIQEGMILENNGHTKKDVNELRCLIYHRLVSFSILALISDPHKHNKTASHAPCPATATYSLCTAVV